MAEESPEVFNHFSRSRARSVIQVGVVHGDLPVQAVSQHPQGERLFVSVTPRDSDSGTLREVHVAVEAYTQQAVILHCLEVVALSIMVGVSSTMGARLGDLSAVLV